MNRKLIGMLVLRKLGYRATRSAKRRILFNIILISLVVAALIFAQIFVVSMSRGIADKYALLGNGHLQIHEEGQINLPQNVDVFDIQKVADSFALIYSHSANKMVRLKGVSSNYFNELRRSALTFLEPKEKIETTLPKVLISSTLAKELDIKQGDRVALMLVNNQSIRPQLCVAETFYDSGYQELDASLVFCDFELMHRLFAGQEETYWELLVAHDQIGSIKQSLLSEGYFVTSWEQENYMIATNLNTSRQAVLGVMIAVAILCGYFISELSRELIEDDKHKIAMLRLLGARIHLIKTSYLLAVMIVTVCSITIGFLLSLVIAHNLSPLLAYVASRSIPALAYYLLDFSVIVPSSDILIIVSILFVVSLISVQWSLRRVVSIAPLACTHFD